MKKFTFLLLFALVCAGTSEAANVDLGVSINVSNHKEPPAYPPPPPPPPAPPEYVEQAPLMVSVVPQFVIVPRLGFHVSIESPFDMFYIDNVYYVYRNDRWYLSDYYDGPWRVVEPHQMPPRLRKYRYQQMIDWRNHEYELYRRDRDLYRDRYYRPEQRDARDRERYEKDREWEREQYKKEREQYEKERERDREAYEKASERERELHEKEREPYEKERKQYEKEQKRHDKKPGRGHGRWKHDD